MRYSDQEKYSILLSRTELANEAAIAYRQFCDSGGGQSDCVCFGCFASWLRNHNPQLLSGLASNWMHFFSFIENKGSLRTDWGIDDLQREIIRDQNRS